MQKRQKRQVRLVNKFWRWIKNEATGERTLRLDGMITDDDFLAWMFDGKTATEFKDELNSGTGDISVWINSEGGDVFAAAKIYNMLKEYKGKVRVKIDSLAASAASVIAMAGDVIEISPVGMIMIHNPSSWVEGDSAEMKTAARMLDEVKESIINAYELKTHLPREQLAQMMDDETWIHAKKAVELGFADKIIGEENSKEEKSSPRDISSRRQVMNCLSNALKASSKPEAKKKIVKAASLRRHLELEVKRQWIRRNAKS